MELESLFSIDLPDVEVDMAVENALQAQAPVCLSISGGKDSTCMVHAVMHFLRTKGWNNPVSLWHADLGEDIEWRDSIRQCRLLAEQYDLKLHIVRANQGSMVTGWHDRWMRNCTRYQNFELRTMIKPWSGPGLFRFCTSGWKTIPIGRGIKQVYGKVPVLNVTGIRREESVSRASTPTSKATEAGKFPKDSITWNPIAAWNEGHVWNCINNHANPIHEAYLAGSSRVSCTFCVLARIEDLKISAGFEGHAATYRTLVRLENDSAFSFQSSRWLGEVAPELLPDNLLTGHKFAVVRAGRRRALEDELPDFNFQRGVPDRMLTFDEAKQIAKIRQEVFRLYPGLQPAYTHADDILKSVESRLSQQNKKGGVQ